MTNEFRAALDRAGYAPSIMQPIQPGRCCCYLCGKPAGGEKMDRHEPWGAANRRKSMELGLWVELHHWGCHEGPGSVHADGERARALRADAQRAAMLRYGWSREEWIARFGKSELSEEEAAALAVDPSGASRHLPFAKGGIHNDGAGALCEGGSQEERRAGVVAPDRGEDAEAGAGAFSRAAALIREFWPDHRTTLRGSGFQLLPDADLPF